MPTALLVSGGVGDLFVKKFPAAFEEVVTGEFAFVAFFHEGLLGKVIGIHKAGAALEHAP